MGQLTADSPGKTFPTMSLGLETKVGDLEAKLRALEETIGSRSGATASFVASTNTTLQNLEKRVKELERIEKERHR